MWTERVKRARHPETYIGTNLNRTKFEWTYKIDGEFGYLTEGQIKIGETNWDTSYNGDIDYVGEVLMDYRVFVIFDSSEEIAFSRRCSDLPNKITISQPGTKKITLRVEKKQLGNVNIPYPIDGIIFIENPDLVHPRFLKWKSPSLLSIDLEARKGRLVSSDREFSIVVDTPIREEAIYQVVWRGGRWVVSKERTDKDIANSIHTIRATITAQTIECVCLLTGGECNHCTFRTFNQKEFNWIVKDYFERNPSKTVIEFLHETQINCSNLDTTDLFRHEAKKMEEDIELKFSDELMVIDQLLSGEYVPSVEAIRLGYGMGPEGWEPKIIPYDPIYAKWGTLGPFDENLLPYLGYDYWYMGNGQFYYGSHEHLLEFPVISDDLVEVEHLAVSTVEFRTIDEPAEVPVFHLIVDEERREKIKVTCVYYDPHLPSSDKHEEWFPTYRPAMVKALKRRFKEDLGDEVSLVNYKRWKGKIIKKAKWKDESVWDSLLASYVYYRQVIYTYPRFREKYQVVPNE